MHLITPIHLLSFPPVSNAVPITTCLQAQNSSQYFCYFQMPLPPTPPHLPACWSYILGPAGVTSITTCLPPTRSLKISVHLYIYFSMFTCPFVYFRNATTFSFIIIVHAIISINFLLLILLKTSLQIHFFNSAFSFVYLLTTHFKTSPQISFTALHFPSYHVLAARFKTLRQNHILTLTCPSTSPSPFNIQHLTWQPPTHIQLSPVYLPTTSTCPLTRPAPH